MGIGYQDKLTEETTNRWWEQAYNKAASNITSTGKKKEEIGFDASAFAKLTDEELFKACGGRTAHKAARHGLHLGGKLERIEHQEKKSTVMNEKPKNNPSKICDSEKILEKQEKCRKEKSLDKKRKPKSSECSGDEKGDTMCNEPIAKKKKRKSTKKHDTNYLDDE